MQATDAQRARRRRGSGQSLVEFALVLPVLLVLLLGIADFGRIFATGTVIEAAARNAAELAAQERRHFPLDQAIPGGYAGIHDRAAKAACREARVLPNSGYDAATDTCSGMPITYVCIHDAFDDACGSAAFGTSVPAECTQLATPPTNAKGYGAEPATFVEVRLCYRFDTLIASTYLPIGSIWLQRARSFTVVDY